MALKLDKVLFALALVLALSVVLVERGGTSLVAGWFGSGDADQEGFGVPALWLVDGPILYTMILIGISMLIPDRIHARVQGVATLIVAVLLFLAAVPLIFEALAALLLRVALLLAIPFGTLIYLAKWADFPVDAMAATMSGLMLLRAAFAVVLVASNPRHLQNKGFVLLIATAFVATIIVAFLHGFVPGIVANLADCIAAIVVGIIAIIWAIVLAIGGIISIVKAIVG